MNKAQALCRASAPGKAILMGEHSAVYGEPALVTALDLRTEAEVFFDTDQGHDDVLIELPDLRTSVRLSWAEIDALRELANQQSQRHLQGDSAFVALDQLAPSSRVPAVALFAAVALGEVSASWSVLAGDAELLETRRHIARVVATSKAPLGAGCGSSAAVATVIVAACESALARLVHDSTDVTVDHDRIEQMALQVERYQHGRPSGVDTAAVRRGGTLLVRKAELAEKSQSGDATSEGGALTIEELSVTEATMHAFSLFFSGSAAESTGVVVDRVRRQRAATPAVVDEHLAALGALTRQLSEALVNADRDGIGPLLQEGERRLEALGVVPAPVRELIREIERRGGFAKVSGAGSIAGPGAGLVLVYDPDRTVEAAFVDGLPQLQPLNATVGATGLIID